jgi:hypothetical protein
VSSGQTEAPSPVGEGWDEGIQIEPRSARAPHPLRCCTGMCECRGRVDALERLPSPPRRGCPDCRPGSGVVGTDKGSFSRGEKDGMRGFRSSGALREISPNRRPRASIRCDRRAHPCKRRQAPRVAPSTTLSSRTHIDFHMCRRRPRRDRDPRGRTGRTSLVRETAQRTCGSRFQYEGVVIRRCNRFAALVLV